MKAWMDEVSEYNPSSPKASHFTQVVWKDTTSVGCAVQSCSGILGSGKARFYVCEYDPPGNFNNDFAYVQVALSTFGKLTLHFRNNVQV